MLADFTPSPSKGGFGYPALSDKTAGPDNLVFGIGGGGVFVIEPRNHEMRMLATHPSLAAPRGILATSDGTVYYGSGAKLWRMKEIGR